jgi:hypothetical protein
LILSTGGRIQFILAYIRHGGMLIECHAEKEHQTVT